MSGASNWRWIDTGVRGPAQNMALTRALMRARQAGEAPSTLRFQRFLPSALVGRHGNPATELDLAYCRARGIAVQRRVTGGGPIYMDEGVLGWELHAGIAEVGTAELAAISARMCAAVAAAIARLGAVAEVRPPTEITAGGRKISGTGGAIDGDTLVYQGTLLVDFDAGEMLRVLAAGPRAGAAAVRPNVVSLREVLGRVPAIEALRAAFAGAFADALGREFEEGALFPGEERRYTAVLEEFDDNDWIGLPAAMARPA